MEGGVEDRDVWNVGNSGACDREGLQRRRLVQRRQRYQPFECCDDRIVDAHGVAKDRTTVDDPMADRVHTRRDVVERLDALRPSGLVDERQLEARRARVDDEDATQNGQAQLRTSG